MKKHPVHLFPLLLLAFVFISPSCKKGGSNNSTNNTRVTGTDTTVVLHGWIVTTLAGGGVTGDVDGDSTNARFTYPFDMTQDADGNLYVMDPSNHKIRMVTPSGRVSTLYVENLVAGDTLDAPSFTTNGHGIIYTVRNSRHVDKLTTAGASLFAGNYLSGYKDGQDTSARFHDIENVTIDARGNLYLPDFNTQNYVVIRKVTPSGLVSTLSLSDNTAPLSSDNAHASIAIDSTGNIYYTAFQSNCIKKIDAQGNVTLFAGSATAGLKDGKGQAAQFKTIIGMATDAAGNLWVSDYKNCAIRKVSPDGTVTTIAGNGTPGYVNGDAATARFAYPIAITVGKKGEIYVLDFDNSSVRKLVYYP